MDRRRHKFKRCLFGGEDGVEFNCAFSGGNIEWRKDIGVSYKDAGAASYDLSSPEIGLHLFHPNARCIASGVLYFKDWCGRSLL